MKATRTQYVVHFDYIAKNEDNIRAVMEDLKENPIEGMHYEAFNLGEGKFMHVNVCENDAAMDQLSKRDSFTRFRNDLRESNPLVEPRSRNIDCVGSNDYNIS